jgi:peptidoglycan/LPS O-acetylase OafA/YrhL
VPPSAPPSPPAFRPDVEGLRAVAIAGVLLAHSGVGLAEGGFAGVDVFFVISGFLITQVLVRELDRTGTVSLTRFFAGRVKRLMPQVLTVIAAVVVASSLLLSPVRADAVASDVMAAGVYAMNWRLSESAVDYFAAGEADRPLDHFWSLAVEEQFYIVWPPLLLALAWICRRRAPGRHAPLVAVLAGVAACSFAYAVQHAAAVPEQAYFSAVARAWELALGGLLAVVLLQRRLPAAAAAWAAWAGAGAILAAVLVLGAGSPMPGAPALLPVLGAAALLAAGTSASPSLPSRALAVRPARFVGRISYAWYVWHWPVLVFAAAGGPLSATEGVAVTLASLVPTLFTHRFIEEPLRRSKAHLRRPRAILVGAIAGPAIAVASGVALSAGLSSPAELAASRAEGAGQLARTGTLQASATALRPRPVDASQDRGKPFEDGCLAEEPARRSPPCVYGARRGAATVVLFGDSHAMQLFPALEHVAERRRWRLVVLAKAGCPPPAVPVVSPLSRRRYPECDAWREHALRRIARDERPALVVAAGSAYHQVFDGSRRLSGAAAVRSLAAGWPPMLRRLQAAAGRVVVVTDPPRPPLDVPSCVSEHLKKLHRCAFRRAPATERSQAATATAGTVAGVTVVDPTDQLCLRDMCPSVIGGVLVYRNSGHLTATFAATLGPWLGRQLPRRPTG